MTARGILVYHHRRRKHPSGARLAAQRDAENPEQPLGFFARFQGKLLTPAHPQRLERFEQLEPTTY